MGLAQSALILLGIGIVSSRFKAGTGLQELGTGITSLVAAPLTGTGTGLSAFSGGLRDLAETLGDLGRGFGTLFENIPALPPGPPRPPAIGGPPAETALPVLPAPRLPSIRPATLITNSAPDLVTGGGLRVPTSRLPPPPPAIVPIPVGPPKISTRPTQIYTRNRDIVML